MSVMLDTAATIAAEIARRLALNTIAQGAETDIGREVFRGRRKLDEPQFPCTVLIEGADTPKDQTSASAQVKLAQRYVLQAYLACDRDNPNDAAHHALRDLKRCIFTTDGQPDSRFGRKVQGVIYHGRDMAARVDGAAFVAAGIEISVEYGENLARP